MSSALPAFSGYGIELEYAIVDRDTLSVMPIADEFLHKLSGSYTSAVSVGEVGWSNELVQHQIELKNIKPHAPIESLLPAFQAEIQRADQILESMGAKLMPAGMHPWMNPLAETNVWRGDNREIYNAYDRIFGCRSHGWANLQSMHLNLPFGDDIQFERLHAAVRILLPILPALAASSPIADGVYSGFLDFRMKNYCEHQMKFPITMGRVIPDTATSPAAYTDEILAQMYREVARSDPEGILQYEWLNARGVIPRFDRNALEIRVIDSQECLQADLAIAAAVTGIVHAFYDEVYATLEEQQAIGTEALAEILQSCIRDGELAIIDNTEYLQLMGFPSRHCEARELWRNLTVIMHQSQVEQSPDMEKAVNTILKQGPLARRILRALGPNWQEAQLRAVYDELCTCLEEGRMFLGLKQLPQRQAGNLSPQS
jgi:gamma-glutamyl:cysteine ligase YbdK (ATP-grasp superfamily)